MWKEEFLIVIYVRMSVLLSNTVYVKIYMGLCVHVMGTHFLLQKMLSFIIGEMLFAELTT